MTLRPFVLVPLIASALIACSQAPPSSTGSGATTPAAPAANRHGLSADVADAADELFTYVEDNLLGVDGGREPLAGEARRQLQALKAINKTQEDKSVTLLLALWMSKDSQRAGLVTMGGPDMVGEVQNLAASRDRCYNEIMGWLEYNDVAPQVLQAGPCLSEARAAAKMLGI